MQELTREKPLKERKNVKPENMEKDFNEEIGCAKELLLSEDSEIQTPTKTENEKKFQKETKNKFKNERSLDQIFNPEKNTNNLSEKGIGLNWTNLKENNYMLDFELTVEKSEKECLDFVSQITTPKKKEVQLMDEILAPKSCKFLIKCCNENQTRFKMRYKISADSNEQDQEVVFNQQSFEHFHEMVCDYFYYKVTPFCEQKTAIGNWLSAKSKLAKKTNEINEYFNKLILIPEINKWEPFLEFCKDPLRFAVTYQSFKEQNVGDNKTYFEFVKDTFNLGVKLLLTPSGNVFFDLERKDLENLKSFLNDNLKLLKCLLENTKKQVDRGSEFNSVRVQIQHKYASNSQLSESSIVKLDSRDEFLTDRLYDLQKIVTVVRKLRNDCLCCLEAVGRGDTILGRYEKIKREVEKQSGGAQANPNEEMRQVGIKLGKVKDDLRYDLMEKMLILKQEIRQIFGSVFVDLAKNLSFRI